ncbi:MAG: hypothetical protein AB7P40_20790 [Chloroflexota bacterium]
MNARQHGRRFLGLFGALSLAVSTILVTPGVPAHAAAQPDFQTGFFPFQSTYAPGENISFSVIYAMNGKTNGPVEVSIDFPAGIGEPQEVMNFGFTCDKQAGASAEGGWRWTCTKPELFDGGEQMTLSMTAPTTPGDFTFRTTIAPVGTTDLDDSDNAAEMTLTVR